MRREFKEVIDDISMGKQRVGLIFDEFVQIMMKFGFAKIEHVDLLNSVFHMMTGYVKPIHAGSQQKFHRTVPLLSIQSLEIVIFAIRNVYDPAMLQDRVVYPEALNENASIPKLKYTFSWQLERQKDFIKFHKVMLPLNLCKNAHVAAMRVTKTAEKNEQDF